MKNIVVILPIVIMSFVLAGCGGSSPGSTGKSNDSSNLLLIQQAASTSLPAIVSVSFKVETDKGAPVIDLNLADNFVIMENGDPISQLEAQPKITPDPSKFVYSSLLLLDLSGSVLGSSFESLKTASKVLIEQIIPVDNPGNLQMRLAYFDGNQHISMITSYLTDQQMLKEAIDALTENLSTDSSTNLNGAVIEGIDEIETKVISEGVADVLSAGSLIIFTDGKDRAGRTSETEALDKVQSSDKNLSIFTIGLGGEIDNEVLTEFGREGFQETTDVATLTESFENIAGLINDQANSYYIFEYCSPKRAGLNNELKIIAKKDKLEGSLIYNFSAVNFTGGCTL